MSSESEREFVATNGSEEKPRSVCQLYKTTSLLSPFSGVSFYLSLCLFVSCFLPLSSLSPSFSLFFKKKLPKFTCPTAHCQRNDLDVAQTLFVFVVLFQCVTLFILPVCFCNHRIVNPRVSALSSGGSFSFFSLVPRSDNSVWERRHCTTSRDGLGRGMGRYHLDKTNCQLPGCSSQI